VRLERILENPLNLLIQSIGRFLRQNANKKIAYLYDLVDDFRVKNPKSKKVHTNFAFKHYLDRLATYRAEKHFIHEKSIYI